MRKYLILFILFIPFVYIDAEVCDNNEIERYKKLSESITYDSEYIGNSDDYQLYSITFNNINDFYLIRSDGTRRITTDSNTLEIDSGKYLFNVYSSKCDEKIDSIAVNLLKYNEYSGSSLCFNLEDKVDLCNPWYQGDVLVKALEKRVEKYYEEHPDELYTEDYEDNTEEDKGYNKIFDNKILIGGIGVGIIVAIILIIYIRNKRSILD